MGVYRGLKDESGTSQINESVFERKKKLSNTADVTSAKADMNQTRGKRKSTFQIANAVQ